MFHNEWHFFSDFCIIYLSIHGAEHLPWVSLSLSPLWIVTMRLLPGNVITIELLRTEESLDSGTELKDRKEGSAANVCFHLRGKGMETGDSFCLHVRAQGLRPAVSVLSRLQPLLLLRFIYSEFLWGNSKESFSAAAENGLKCFPVCINVLWDGNSPSTDSQLWASSIKKGKEWFLKNYEKIERTKVSQLPSALLLMGIPIIWDRQILPKYRLNP